MPYESTDVIQQLSRCAANTRNFCMVAHVDHGKTTLSDYLVASNGILSPQLAGEVRLLDSRPDEQERCITMKASSIALLHVHDNVRHVLNLVDSPGHIDFSCEVSTAMRLCDGAAIIVDVVDGVTQQTYAMLRHTYKEGLSMCLILNKIDLLITTQQCTPEEAYLRMRSIIETCNAALAAYALQLKIQQAEGDMDREDPSDEVWFDPSKGNVLFCSCYDGWAFSVDFFATLYAEKVPVENMTLKEALWGQNYYNPKTKSVSHTRKKDGQLPMAVQLMLEPIWKLYDTFLEEPSDDVATRQVKLAEKIGVAEKVWNHPRRTSRAKLKALLGAWLPLAKCVLDTICVMVDSPVVSQQRRIADLVPNFAEASPVVQKALLTCDTSEDAPCIVYVCKLIDTQHLVGHVIGQAANSEDAFIGFCRVYSGRLRLGQSVYVHSSDGVTQCQVAKVFLFRGAGLDEADEACAGSLCGVGGLTPYITKYATISSLPDVPPFKPLVLPSTSIVRLSVFPKHPRDLQQLGRGLQLLNKVDPQVEVSILATGEHVIGTAGEVHAERCIKDLSDTFAQVEIVASEPLVSFRETIIGGTSGKAKLHSGTLMDGAFSITLCARSCPQEVLDILQEDEANNGSNVQLVRQVESLLRAHKRFSAEVEANGLVSWGPSKQGFLGAVLLVDFSNAGDPERSSACFQAWKESIIAGFQAAAENGPMALEPMFGMVFIISDLCIDADSGLSGGMILPCVRDACKAAMELHPRRLVEPVYECTVYSSGQTQGKVYAALSRRRSEILEEVPNEGSDLFYIRSWLPAVEAFGLQDELRVLTQGASTAQLQMSHWSMVEADPYFVPTTKEELEEHGKEMATKNIAEQLLERVRRRKGLFRERTVENAEKQKFSLKARVRQGWPTCGGRLDGSAGYAGAAGGASSPSNGSGGGSGDDRTSLECGQQSASPNGSLSNSNSHSSQVKVFVGMVEDFNQHDGSRLLVNVKGRYVAVVYHKGNFYAIDNACYHHGGPLLRGDIEELGGHPCVVCPWHQYKISLKTGEGLYFSIDNIQSSCPTTTLKSKGCKQRVHQVAVEDSKVYLLADFGGEEVESDRYANMALTNPDEENGRVVVHRSPSGSISRRSDDAVVVRSGNGISLHSSISDAHFVGHLRSGEAFRRFSSGRGAGALNPLDSTKRFRSPLSPGSSASTSKFSAGRLNPAKGGEVAAPSTTRAKMSNLSVSCTQMEDVCEGVKEFFFSRVEGTILRQCVLGEYVDLELPIRDPDTGSMMRRRWTICDTNKRGSLFSLMVKARRERAESGSAWLTGMSLHVPLRVIDVAGSFTIIDHFERIRSLQGNALWLTAGIGIVSAYAAVNSTLNDSFFVRNNPSNRERFHMVHVHIDQTYNSIPRVGDFVHHATTFGPRLQKDSQRPPPHSEHIRYAFTAILTRQEKLGLSGSVAPEGMIIPLGRRPTMEELELQVKKAFGAAPFLAFLCGPPQFVQECAAMLIQLGVPSQDILTDAV